MVDPFHPHIDPELKATKVRDPSNMIAIAETRGGPDKEDFFLAPWVGGLGTMHNGGANVLFCDGHVKWFDLKEVSLPVPSVLPELVHIRRMWNRDNEP